MIIILDSNEYILYLNEQSPLFTKLFGHDITIFVHELIVKEVLRNISSLQRKAFYQLLFKSHFTVFHEPLPFSLNEKYKRLGLKKGDSIIAAFCEHIQAGSLITENRHFLKSKLETKLNITTLNEFLGNV